MLVLKGTIRMPPNAVDGLISRLELVLPKNVLQTCVSLQRGFAAEFLSTNLQKCTASRIKVAKQIDESVRLTVTVSRLQGENRDRPEHILIHGLKDDAQEVHQNQSAVGTEQSTGENIQPTPTDAPCEVTSPVNPQDTSEISKVLGSSSITSINNSSGPNIGVLPSANNGETNDNGQGKLTQSLDQEIGDTTQDRAQESLPSCPEDTCVKGQGNDKTPTLPSCGIDDIDLSTLSTSDVSKLVDTQEAADILSSIGEGELNKTIETWDHEDLKESLSQRKSDNPKTCDGSIEMKESGLIYIEAHLPANMETNEEIQDGNIQVEGTSPTKNTGQHIEPCTLDHETRIPIAEDNILSSNTSRKQEVNKTKCNKSHGQVIKRNPSADRSHMSRPHYKREQNVQCQFCPAKLKDNESLFEHTKLKHCHEMEYEESIKTLRELMKVKCSLCNQVYSRREQLSVHMNLMHCPNTAENCPKCGLRVKSKRHLNEHIRRVHNNTERVHLCHLCPASFRLPSYLSAHLKFVHTSNREDAFPCDECGKTYSSDKYLSNHKMRVHSSKRHVCGYCSKTFTTYPNMQRHILLLHEKKGEKPFQCEVCGRRFSLKANLKDHVKTLHLNSYPVHCSICDLGFRRKKDLKIHKMHAHGMSESSSTNGLRQLAPSISQGPITVVPAVSEGSQDHPAGDNPAVQYIMATPEILQAFGIQLGPDTNSSATATTADTHIQFSTETESGERSTPDAATDTAVEGSNDFDGKHQQTVVIQSVHDQEDIPAQTTESVEGNTISETMTTVTTMDISRVVVCS